MCKCVFVSVCMGERDGFILGHWFVQWWGLTNLKFPRQASQLETQEKLTWQLKVKAIWRHSFLSLEGTSVFCLRPSTESVRPTYTTEGNLLHSVFADLNLNPKTPSWKHLEWCLIKYLWAMAKLSWCIKLTIRDYKKKQSIDDSLSWFFVNKIELEKQVESEHYFVSPEKIFEHVWSQSLYSWSNY